MIIKETLVKGIDGFGFSLKETDNGFQTVIRLDNLGGALEVGDLLLSIDGLGLRGFTHEQVVQRLHNYPVNAEATLTISRPSNSQFLRSFRGPTKDDIRDQIWSMMEELNLADFPRPCHQRIPNFRGSKNACEKLLGLDCFRRAVTIKVNPDKPQETARFLALQFNKTLLVPTPRLRHGLFNQVVPPYGFGAPDLKLCCNAEGVKHYGVPVPLKSNLKVDLIIVGSVAVSEKGYRIGKGEGFADMEWGMMATMGCVKVDTIVVTIVHDCQVMDIPEELIEAHDITVDIILTPRRIIYCPGKLPRPGSLLWDKITMSKMREIPSLARLVALARQRGIHVPMPREENNVNGSRQRHTGVRGGPYQYEGYEFFGRSNGSRRQPTEFGDGYSGNSWNRRRFYQQGAVNWNYQQSGNISGGGGGGGGGRRVQRGYRNGSGQGASNGNHQYPSGVDAQYRDGGRPMQNANGNASERPKRFYRRQPTKRGLILNNHHHHPDNFNGGKRNGGFDHRRAPPRLQRRIAGNGSNEDNNNLKKPRVSNKKERKVGGKEGRKKNETEEAAMAKETVSDEMQDAQASEGLNNDRVHEADQLEEALLEHAPLGGEDSLCIKDDAANSSLGPQCKESSPPSSLDSHDKGNSSSSGLEHHSKKESPGSKETSPRSAFVRKDHRREQQRRSPNGAGRSSTPNIVEEIEFNAATDGAASNMSSKPRRRSDEQRRRSSGKDTDTSKENGALSSPSADKETVPSLMNGADGACLTAHTLLVQPLMDDESNGKMASVPPLMRSDAAPLTSTSTGINGNVPSLMDVSPPLPKNVAPAPAPVAEGGSSSSVSCPPESANGEDGEAVAAALAALDSIDSALNDDVDGHVTALANAFAAIVQTNDGNSSSGAHSEGAPEEAADDSAIDMATTHSFFEETEIAGSESQTPDLTKPSNHVEVTVNVENDREDEEDSDSSDSSASDSEDCKILTPSMKSANSVVEIVREQRTRESDSDTDDEDAEEKEEKTPMKTTPQNPVSAEDVEINVAAVVGLSPRQKKYETPEEGEGDAVTEAKVSPKAVSESESKFSSASGDDGSDAPKAAPQRSRIFGKVSSFWKSKQ